VISRATDLAARPAEYRNLSLTGPRRIGARLPTGPKERSDLIFNGIAGKDAQDFPKYYVPYAEVVSEPIRSGKPITRSSRNIRVRAKGFVHWRPNLDDPKAILRAFRCMAASRSWAVIDARDGRLAGILPFDPY
jgi:hypothetical protein